MAANLGKIKTGGRKKGTPNKKDVFSVHERLKELGVDLIGDILVDIEQMTNAYDRAKCRLQLLEYCASKRKATEAPPITEIDKQVQEIREKSDAELIELVKEEISKAA